MQRGCLPDWDLYQGSCYRLGTTGLASSDANFACSYHYEGDLAEISTEEENNFVKELLRRDATDDETSAWIRMSQDGRGIWYDLQEEEEEEDLTDMDWDTFSFTGFLSESPKCAIFSEDDDWAWRETDCDEEISSRTFVCERDSLQTECFEGSCYDLLSETSDIGSAHDTCKALGGYVVEIDTKEEQNFVKDFLNRAQVPESLHFSNSDETVWLGASYDDEDGKFYWKNGGTEVGEFPGWADGEPSYTGPRGRQEDCAELDGNRDWEWNDTVCITGLHAVLCERPNISPISG